MLATISCKNCRRCCRYSPQGTTSAINIFYQSFFWPRCQLHLRNLNNSSGKRRKRAKDTRSRQEAGWATRVGFGVHRSTDVWRSHQLHKHINTLRTAGVLTGGRPWVAGEVLAGQSWPGNIKPAKYFHFFTYIADSCTAAKMVLKI